VAFGIVRLHRADAGEKGGQRKAIDRRDDQRPGGDRQAERRQPLPDGAQQRL
jgi:hypothetical protein